MSNLSITKKIIQHNFQKGRQKINKPEYVIVHTYNGKGESLYNWFNNPNSNVSAHYAIFKNGNIEQYVLDKDIAFHAGNWEANLYSIGIEHQDDGNPGDSVRTNSLYESSAQLIASLFNTYGWDKTNMDLIMPHYSYAPTGCPGGLDFYKIRARVYEILNGNNWKSGFVEHEESNTPDCDVYLYDIITHEKKAVFSKNTEIVTKYKKDGFLMTEYSFKNNIPHAFLAVELRYRNEELTNNQQTAVNNNNETTVNNDNETTEDNSQNNNVVDLDEKISELLNPKQEVIDNKKPFNLFIWLWKYIKLLLGKK
jgi:hypothetical protein